jgi:hypothetical protein
MKYFFIFFLFANFRAYTQGKVTITQKGWLVYKHGDLLAFLPIKDQSKTPTYSNFFTENKGEGERMNNSNSAPPKLLIAKTFFINTYKYDSLKSIDTLVGKYEFYIQPVKYVYQVENIECDTAEFMTGGWTLKLNSKTRFCPVYYFDHRIGEIQFLNKSDSLFASKGGRRKQLEIYPPH